MTRKKKRMVIYLNMILANGMILCQRKTGNIQVDLLVLL